MTPPAAKRRRSVEHAESTRNINVVKGGLSIMCPADSMGMLIGKGGSGLRGMQEKSGVKVSLQETKSMPEGAKERGVGLSGSLPNVAAVEKIIFEKLNARRVTALAPSPAEEEFEIAYQAAKAAGLPVNTVQEGDNDPSKVTVVRWVMDNSHCGWLIGKGGSGIQNIEATSGAEVRVATEKSMTKESGERIVYIKGTPFQREKALDMIRSNPKISGRVAGAKEPETAAVHVPSKAIGFILGHRGASIQALTEKTGAQLRVAPSSEITTGSSEHRVDITGGPQQIVAARHALGERIEEWRATNNPSSAPEEIEYSIKIAVPQPLVGHIIGKGGQFVREVLAITSVQVKIQQDTGSPTLWGDACCVMLSGTMDNVVQAQQMILERIANISDRLKDMVPNAVTLSADQDPDDPVRKLEVNIQLPDGPPPAQAEHNFQQPPPFGQQPPAFGFAPPFGQPGPGGPFMPGQQQFQPQFQQQQFQQPPPQQQQQQQGYRQPQAPSGPPGDNVTFTSIRQLNAPGLTAASKQPGGLELLVDNSVVGSIIGKGGQTIRKISTESGATIQVQGRDDVSPSLRERRVTVTSDDMPVLLNAANMICAVLRNNEKLSMAARQGGAPGAGGGPGSNGAAGGGGDRERGAPRGPGPNNGPRGGSGPPPASPSGGAAPANFPFQQQQQQQQPVPVQFSPTPAMAAFPPQQGFVAQQPVPGGAPIQQAYQYPQQVPGQGPPQQQQLVQQVPQQQQPSAQAAPGQFAQQQQPIQQGQQPPQGQQPGQPGQQPGAVFYQQPAGANGPPQGAPQGVQYAQPQQQPPQQQPPQQQQAPAQQQQQPHMQQQTPQQQQQQLPVQQLPLQGQAQPAASGAAVPPTSSPAPVYGWVYDQASGTYTAAPAAATPAPQSSSFPAQPQYSQQQQQQPPQQQQPQQQR